MDTIKIKLDDGAKAPTRAYPTDAGLDLYSREDVVISARESHVFDTGVHIEIPEGYMGLMFSKSGLNINKGLTSEGIIDANYSGSLKTKLYNNSGYDRRIKAGDKISQLIIVPIATPEVVIVDEIAEQGRGNNGFGSSGR
jgi:dUTP pyrophosphatase